MRRLIPRQRCGRKKEELTFYFPNGTMVLKVGAPCRTKQRRLLGCLHPRRMLNKSDTDGSPIYVNTIHYAVLKKEWGGTGK